MPPKVKYNKSIIIDSAFEIVRESGIERVSVRNIANRIGCSTQPVYSFFNSFNDLKKELLEKLKTYSKNYILNYESKETKEVFLSIGMGYLSFSQKEPMIFKSLFINEGWNWIFSCDNNFYRSVIERMKKDKALMELDDKILSDLFRDMLIYTQGLTSKNHLSSKPLPLPEANYLLKRMGGILIVSALTKSDKEINEIMLRYHK